MDLKTKLRQLADEGKALAQKAANHPSTFTKADADRADHIVQEHARITKLLDSQKKVSAQINAVTKNGPTYDMGGIQTREGVGRGRVGSLAFAQASKTEAFTTKVTKAFEDAAPMIGGPAVGKALVNTGQVVSDFDGTIVVEPKPTHHILSAITTEPVDRPKGQYLRQIARDNNATTVPMRAKKPTSTYTLVDAEWEVATIAHLTNPIPKQYLEDYAGMTDFFSSELAFGLQIAATELVLNGGTAESGNEIHGILNTTGVGQTTFVDSPARTIRRAITELEREGVAPSHIVINPDDWEELEASLGQGNWAVGGTPLDRAEQKLWSVPVIVDANMPAGQTLIGDLSTVVFVHRGTAQLSWSEAGITEPEPETEHTDLFARNLVRFRCEVRGGIVIASPPSLRIAALAA